MIENPNKLIATEELPPVSPWHTIDEIHNAVLNLHHIAQNLRKQRFEEGALRLDQVRNIAHIIFCVVYGFAYFTYWAFYYMSVGKA